MAVELYAIGINDEEYDYRLDPSESETEYLQLDDRPPIKNFFIPVTNRIEPNPTGNADIESVTGWKAGDEISYDDLVTASGDANIELVIASDNIRAIKVNVGGTWRRIYTFKVVAD